MFIFDSSKLKLFSVLIIYQIYYFWDAWWLIVLIVGIHNMLSLPKTPEYVWSSSHSKPKTVNISAKTRSLWIVIVLVLVLVKGYFGVNIFLYIFRTSSWNGNPRNVYIYLNIHKFNMNNCFSNIRLYCYISGQSKVIIK